MSDLDLRKLRRELISIGRLISGDFYDRGHAGAYACRQAIGRLASWVIEIEEGLGDDLYREDEP